MFSVLHLCTATLLWQQLWQHTRLILEWLPQVLGTDRGHKTPGETGSILGSSPAHPSVLAQTSKAWGTSLGVRFLGKIKSSGASQAVPGSENGSELRYQSKNWRTWGSNWSWTMQVFWQVSRKIKRPTGWWGNEGEEEKFCYAQLWLEWIILHHWKAQESHKLWQDI